MNTQTTQIIKNSKIDTVKQIVPSSKILKKFKKHERDALLPLYKDHINKYLLRLIAANKNIIPELLQNFIAWQSVGTCHEIALNSLGLNLQTHQNNAGKEYEYSTHVKAKNVSRDRRVKLIWALLYEAIQTNPNLEGIRPLVIEGAYIYCPVCHETIAEHTERGYEFDVDNACKCITFGPGGIQNDFIRDNVPGNTLDYIEMNHTIFISELELSVISEKWQERLLDIADKRYVIMEKCLAWNNDQIY